MAKINLYKNTDYFEFTQPNPTEGKRCRKPDFAKSNPKGRYILSLVNRGVTEIVSPQ